MKVLLPDDGKSFQILTITSVSFSFIHHAVLHLHNYCQFIARRSYSFQKIARTSRNDLGLSLIPLESDYLAESRESLRRFLICQIISFLATERIFRSRFRVCLPRRCLSADSHCRGIGFKPFFRYARLDIRRMLRISRWSTIVWFSPALPTDAKLSRVPAFQA